MEKKMKHKLGLLTFRISQRLPESPHFSFQLQDYLVVLESSLVVKQGQERKTTPSSHIPV
jgi:hypothetical protein